MDRRIVIAVSFAAVAAAALFAPGCEGPADIHRFSFETMGTVATGTVEVWDKTLRRTPEELVEATFDSVNVRLSSWLEDSEVGRLNAAPADTALAVSEWLAYCLQASDALNRASGGAFDVTAEPLMRLWGFYRREGHLPSQAELDSVRALMGHYDYDASMRTVTKGRADTKFDFGGIAKGFAVDRAVKNLVEFGISSALIDLGGNIFCLGVPDGREAWRLGVRDPRNRSAVLATFSAVHKAMATSGAYERFVEIDGRRYGHIMNPATGRPAEGLLSVTVIGRRATMCDGLSTTLYVAAPEEAQRLLREVYRRYDAVLVLPPEDGEGKARVLATAGLKGNLELTEEAKPGYSLSFLSF
jgi:thiamine biosynthesis lipoprotein